MRRGMPPLLLVFAALLVRPAQSAAKGQLQMNSMQRRAATWASTRAAQAAAADDVLSSSESASTDVASGESLPRATGLSGNAKNNFGGNYAGNAAEEDGVSTVVPCEVGVWSDWSQCSLACVPPTGGRGLQTRSRAVINNHGQMCPNLIETRKCDPPPCPVACRVTAWTNWSGCTSPCEDSGTEFRTRAVVSEPIHGGAECPPLSEEKSCNAAPCPKPEPNCNNQNLKNCSDNGLCTLKGCECFVGFSGDDCSQVLERDCKNDCSGHGKCRTATSTCVCDEGYDGEDCSEGHCPNDCSGHGTCMTEPQLYCQCSFGYVGMDCADKICPNDCSGHGYCEASGKCQCHDGYSSSDCSSGECPSDCNGNGVCVDGACECNIGFKGKGCEQRHCGPECVHGQCVNDECVCFKNYVGANCATKVCTDGETCNGHGMCTVDQKCSCQDGFIGEFCEERPCPGNCNGHGLCLSGLCKCDFPYEGAACAIKGCDHRCSLHGRCIDGECLCHPGYTGPLCGEVVCLNNCSGHGTCGGDGTCQCQGGYAGADCTIPRCPNDCSGHGVCEGTGEGGRGKCKCQERYGASDCSMELAMSIECEHGYSIEGECFCVEGYTGDKCSEKICAKRLVDGLICSGHGICNPQNGTCVCESGFIGSTCSHAQDSTVLTDSGADGKCPDECSGHGECTSTGCECVEGYRGVACKHEVCPLNCSSHGICAHGKCHCDQGFKGEACAVPICEGNCSGRGVCRSPGKCECNEPTWIGNNCEESICGAGCDKERGICNPDKTCTCLDGFAGADCSCPVTSLPTVTQAKLNIGSQEPQACSGHGVCAGRQCFCDTNHPWGGKDCSELVCPNECSARGECVEGVCECLQGFSGNDCSLSSCPNDCSGHGECVDGISESGEKECVCLGGWGGAAADCSERVCAYNCNNNGLCKNGTCFCNGNWQGEFCENPVCNPECIHGACHNGKCDCEESWWGEACDRVECVHGIWSEKASTVDPAFSGCKCELGWSGPECNTTKHCLPGTCANGGYCGRDAQCVCANGFTGASCEQVVCPNSCSGHGSCNAEEFKCDCDAGYDGFVCEVEASFGLASDVMRSLRGTSG